MKQKAKQVIAACKLFIEDRGSLGEDNADSLIHSLDAAGYVIVPTEPTREMMIAFLGGELRPSGEEMYFSSKGDFDCRYAFMLQAVGVEMNWLPMDQAPRDGQQIVARASEPMIVSWARGGWCLFEDGASFSDDYFIGWSPIPQSSRLLK